MVFNHFPDIHSEEPNCAPRTHHGPHLALYSRCFIATSFFSVSPFPLKLSISFYCFFPITHCLGLSCTDISINLFVSVTYRALPWTVIYRYLTLIFFILFQKKKKKTIYLFTILSISESPMHKVCWAHAPANCLRANLYLSFPGTCRESPG
jgi:hypothetical protein